MDFLTVPERTARSRDYGITSVIDLGVPIGQLEQILEDYSAFIDFAKLGIGTAYVTPRLQEKINLYKAYGIKPYFGGTLFEKCYQQNKIPEYLQALRKLGIEWIEVSSGTIDIPLEERLKLIEMFKGEFHCLAEVGSKDRQKEMDIFRWKREIRLLLNAGSKYCITEGRESGTSGVYDQNGNVNSALVQTIVQDLDVKKIIFEAPEPNQQMYFINQIGANVNLGNIKLTDVLLLETERRGLRCETFFLEDPHEHHMHSSSAN